LKYLVEFEEGVEKDIYKIRDNVLIKDIYKKIGELSTNPMKGKHLFDNLYELKSKNYRVYYYVFKGIVEIEKVVYDGKVKVNKLGTKDSQKRDLK
jgi:mRNA-degrading endonuclease RelE of RelBE toxin-antitoxin system